LLDQQFLQGYHLEPFTIGTMLTTDKFEIRVALVGYVSVGKTTVLNAIFRDKFSEVAQKRTTAGINFFRIINPVERGTPPAKQKASQMPEIKVDPEPRTAASKRTSATQPSDTKSAKKAKKADETRD
jgi:GTPase SAR1 family protein